MYVFKQMNFLKILPTSLFPTASSAMPSTVQWG